MGANKAAIGTSNLRPKSLGPGSPGPWSIDCAINLPHYSRGWDFPAHEISFLESETSLNEINVDPLFAMDRGGQSPTLNPRMTTTITFRKHPSRVSSTELYFHKSINDGVKACRAVDFSTSCLCFKLVCKVFWRCAWLEASTASISYLNLRTWNDGDFLWTVPPSPHMIWFDLRSTWYGKAYIPRDEFLLERQHLYYLHRSHIFFGSIFFSPCLLVVCSSTLLILFFVFQIIMERGDVWDGMHCSGVVGRCSCSMKRSQRVANAWLLLGDPNKWCGQRRGLLLGIYGRRRCFIHAIHFWKWYIVWGVYGMGLVGRKERMH